MGTQINLWKVNLPAEEVPPELPERALGISFAKDGMNRWDWLSLIVVCSDCWLRSVALYLGAMLNHNARDNFLSYSLCLGCSSESFYTCLNFLDILVFICMLHEVGEQ